MKSASNALITMLYLIGFLLIGSHAKAQEKPPLAEQVFKNVQVLRGMSVNEFMETMGFFAASLNANCTTCHGQDSGGSWESYASDKLPQKQTARRMIVMMNMINQTYFSGRQVLTCYSCHRFGRTPEIVPDLAVQYGDAPDKDPAEILSQAPGQPAPDQVLEKFFRAIGGADKVSSVSSFVAKGTWQGYDDTEQHPLEIYAKAPNQRTSIVDNHGALTTNTYDGANGWIAAPYTDVPVTLLPLAGSDLDNARVDAELSFPAQIKRSLTDLRVGPPFLIGDKDVTILQGYSPAKSPVKLYFDSETGLLLRMVRYTSSRVGRQPTQFDYSDYRDVNGIKMPFHWVTTWVDGRSKTQLNEVQLNVPIDQAKFGKPAEPAKK
ncbi:MAG TPA: photosynthetic reaction center cytochrome c subunit family protein [Candidatus Acidoferrales bacterium]|nr:photosynthetic reaction center cytochrome c subunit family protein [Verrucomicrobiae bacterium]HZP33692.1 photosynthetic reaction center cytochrome c subunit family protein [Candidatus Acidoferrales bacterium]